MLPTQTSAEWKDLEEAFHDLGGKERLFNVIKPVRLVGFLINDTHPRRDAFHAEAEEIDVRPVTNKLRCGCGRIGLRLVRIQIGFRQQPTGTDIDMGLRGTSASAVSKIRERQACAMRLVAWFRQYIVKLHISMNNAQRDEM